MPPSPNYRKTRIKLFKILDYPRLVAFKCWGHFKYQWLFPITGSISANKMFEYKSHLLATYVDNKIATSITILFSEMWAYLYHDMLCF